VTIKKNAEHKKDTLFSHPMGAVQDFTFDSSVASVFPDMIQRSVPGYSTVVAISGVLAQRFSQPGTRLYDLGCSLGATSFAMAQRAVDSCEVFAVDNASAMLDQLATTLAEQSLPTPISLVNADIIDVDIKHASVVAMNYTLQFIDIAERAKLLTRIREGMVDNGVLILSEKIQFDSTQVNELFIDLHHDFKRANGYSDLEISQKRDAIENVLVPESLAMHRQRLEDCGFSRVEVWFQCFNFASLVAFK
tara:strand:- start:247 stop:993 length:747 start_codon:yes stop_codon:yes gene_type:complete